MNVTCPGPDSEQIPLRFFDDEQGSYIGSGPTHKPVPVQLAVSVADGRAVLSIGPGGCGLPVMLSPADCQVLGRLLLGTVDPTSKDADPGSTASTAGLPCPGSTPYTAHMRGNNAYNRTHLPDVDTDSVVDAIRDYCHDEQP